MGKLDCLLGRSLNGSKLKTLLNLSISRLAVLRNQRQSRSHLARSDIVQILHLGHHDRALFRVELVIKEQNMLDVFVMIEGYCNSLAERTNLIKHEKVCPEELKEAVSGLLYASTRCGEFPELIQMRALFTSRFGKEFAARAIELRNNCGVNPKMIQKLSTRPPSLEIRLKVLKEIAAENSIVLQIDNDSSFTPEEKFQEEPNLLQPKPEASENPGGLTVGDGLHYSRNMENVEQLSQFSGSIQAGRIYKDVAEAAEEAFKSAAHAAVAARAAVELSKSEARDPDGHDNPGSERRGASDEIYAAKYEAQPTKQSSFSTTKDQSVESHSGGSSTGSEDGEIRCKRDYGRNEVWKGSNFDDGDDENGDRQNDGLLPKICYSGLDLRSGFVANEDGGPGNLNPNTGDPKLYRSQKKFPLRSEATHGGSGNSAANLTDESPKIQALQGPEEKKPVSVRTRVRDRRP